MTGTSMVARKPGDRLPGRRPLVDEELADQLLGKAQAEGAGLLGPDGLLSQVTKAVLESALAEEMTGHLGYDKHDLAGRGSGNRLRLAGPEAAWGSGWCHAGPGYLPGPASASGGRGGGVVADGADERFGGG